MGSPGADAARAPRAGRGTARDAGRADYAPIEAPREGAWISAVEPDSPAEAAGVRPGLRVDAVNGVALDDIITWRWEASEGTVWLDLSDEDGVAYEVELAREPGQSWGIEFSDVLFDGIRTCRNACLFCFMGMLPPEARGTLLLRDDDYRLSFLQGNFVTLTNLSDADVDRIVSWRLEPMNVSLHAVTPEVRRRLIGRNEARGREVLERLCEAGVEVHAQVVVCPGINDGDELDRTLRWAEERPNVTSLALVPMGYTKYSRRFTSSFSDDEGASRAVVELVAPFQERARERCGRTVFQLSDEFYLDARMEVPPAETYDGYPQFYDGIGMLRSFMDETDLVARERAGDLAALRAALAAGGRRALVVCGEAAAGVVDRLCDAWGLSPSVSPLAVRNDYYGGDVNVTGLVVAEDLLAQLPAELGGACVVLPESMLNFAGVTLDDWPLGRLAAAIRARGGEAGVCRTSPGALLEHLVERLGGMGGAGGVG